MIIAKIETETVYIDDQDLFQSEEERELYFSSSPDERSEFLLDRINIDDDFTITTFDEDDCYYDPAELYFQ